MKLSERASKELAQEKVENLTIEMKMLLRQKEQQEGLLKQDQENLQYTQERIDKLEQEV